RTAAAIANPTTASRQRLILYRLRPWMPCQSALRTTNTPLATPHTLPQRPIHARPRGPDCKRKPLPIQPHKPPRHQVANINDDQYATEPSTQVVRTLIPIAA